MGLLALLTAGCASGLPHAVQPDASEVRPARWLRADVALQWPDRLRSESSGSPAAEGVPVTLERSCTDANCGLLAAALEAQLVQNGVTVMHSAELATARRQFEAAREEARLRRLASTLNERRPASGKEAPRGAPTEATAPPEEPLPPYPTAQVLVVEGVVYRPVTEAPGMSVALFNSAATGLRGSPSLLLPAETQRVTELVRGAARFSPSSHGLGTYEVRLTLLSTDGVPQWRYHGAVSTRPSLEFLSVLLEEVHDHWAIRSPGGPNGDPYADQRPAPIPSATTQLTDPLGPLVTDVVTRLGRTRGGHP